MGRHTAALALLRRDYRVCSILITEPWPDGLRRHLSGAPTIRGATELIAKSLLELVGPTLS